MKEIFNEDQAKTNDYISLCEEIEEKRVLRIGKESHEGRKDRLALELCKRNIFCSLSQDQVSEYTWHSRLAKTGYLNYKQRPCTEKNPPKKDKS